MSRSRAKKCRTAAELVGAVVRRHRLGGTPQPGQGGAAAPVTLVPLGRSGRGGVGVGKGVAPPTRPRVRQRPVGQQAVAPAAAIGRPGVRRQRQRLRVAARSGKERPPSHYSTLSGPGNWRLCSGGILFQSPMALWALVMIQLMHQDDAAVMLKECWSGRPALGTCHLHTRREPHVTKRPHAWKLKLATYTIRCRLTALQFSTARNAGRKGGPKNVDSLGQSARAPHPIHRSALPRLRAAIIKKA